MTDQSDDLQGEDLRGANLHGANLVGVDLSGTVLRSADLTDAALVGANLRDADLSGADLTGASLVDADLSGADLTDTVLTDASLSGADLSNTNIAEARFEDDDSAVTDDGTSLAAVVSTVVTGATLALAFGLLALGWSYFWIVFIIGFAGVLPVATQLASWYEARGATAETDTASLEEFDEQATALERLRERYASGEIDETEFERRVERLLETESVDDAEAFYHGSDSSSGTETAEREREAERA